MTFEEDMIRQNQDVYIETMDNATKFMQNMMEVKSFMNLTEAQLDKIKSFIPVGKDLILSDLTDAFDRELFIKYSQQLSNLILMQKRYYIKDGVMSIGILPAIEIYFQKFIYFIISTRAKGPDRERMAQTNTQHLLNKLAAGQKRPGVVDKTFGG